MEENNKLIAKFMGVVFHDDENQYYDNNGLYIGEDLQYHSSWDWLMPVVDKINTMDDFNYSVSINYHYTSITDNNTLYDIVDESADGNTIDCRFRQGCYKAVVKFIEWYNESKLNEDGK